MKGGTENHVTSQTTSEVIIRIDLSGCMELPPEERSECIKAVTDSLQEIEDIAKVLYCTRINKTSPGSEGADPTFTCGDLDTLEINKHRNSKG